MGQAGPEQGRPNPEPAQTPMTPSVTALIGLRGGYELVQKYKPVES